MKQTLIFLCGIFSFSVLSAQDFDWSNLQKFRNKTSYNRIIGENESGYFILRSRNREVKSSLVLERYRDAMGIDYSKKLPDMRGASLVNAFVCADHLNIIKSRYNVTTERLNLTLQQLDNNGNAKGPEKLLREALPKDYSDDGNFVFVSNPWQNRYLCYYVESGPQEKIVVNFAIYDEQMVLLQDKKLQLDFGVKDFTTMDVLVDSLGNAAFLFEVMQPDFGRGTPEKVGYYLYHYQLAEKNLKSYYLNYPDTYLSDPAFVVDRLNNKLGVTGFYSLESNRKSKGLLDFAIDIRSQRVLYHNFIPYERSFVAEIIGEKAANKESELVDYDIRKVIPRSDGGYILIAEEFFISQQSYTYYINGIAQVNSRSVFNFGKIFVLSITPQGKPEWGKMINKTQSSINDGGHYSSLFVTMRKDKIHILFNDKLRGVGDVLQFTLDNKGNLDNILLFRSQNSYIAIVPSEGKQLDANTVLLPTSKDRKFAFVKINY